MGTDWLSYHQAFANANVRSTPGFEPAFVFYTFLIRSVTDNYSVYLLITTAIIFGGIFYTVFSMTQFSFLSFYYLVGIIPWYAGTLRQMIGCVFFTLALRSALDRKFRVFILLMSIGTLFHTTILPFFAIYWLVGISWTSFAFVFIGLAAATFASRNVIAAVSAIVGTIGLRPFESRIGGSVELSDPLFGFLRKALTIAGFGIFAFAANTSPNTNLKQQIEMRFMLMLVSLSIILYYVGTYVLAFVSSRLDIYVSVVAASVLIGVIDRSLTSRANRMLLFAFVTVLLQIFYSRLEYMDLFHPYSAIFYNRDYGRQLY